jgi:hypothetical protein
MTLIATGREASYDAMMMDLINKETEHLFETDCYHQTCDKTEIKPSGYHKTEINDVVEKCTYLNKTQRGELKQMLSKFKLLFNGELKTYTGKKIHLDLKLDAKPVHRRTFSLTKSQKALFKAELQHLMKAGVFERTGASEWASPIFIIPKKTGKARWVSDFRNLNKYLIRKQFPLPKIGNILAKSYKQFILAIRT